MPIFRPTSDPEPGLPAEGLGLPASDENPPDGVEGIDFEVDRFTDVTDFHLSGIDNSGAVDAGGNRNDRAKL